MANFTFNNHSVNVIKKVTKLCLVLCIFSLYPNAFANNLGQKLTKQDLENQLTSAEKVYGEHAEELLPILEKLVVITQKDLPNESKNFNIRRTKIYLRHNSSAFVAQFKDTNLPTTRHSKKTLKQVNKFFKRDFTLYETKHWSIIHHSTQEEAVTKKIAPFMEKAYDSALSFLISFGYRNKPLKNKMTAIYFQSREDYIEFLSKFTFDKKLLKNSLGVYIDNINTLAFFDNAENKKRVRRRTVLHEAAHQIMFNAGLQLNQVNQPRWLIEGLASSFEASNINLEFGPHTNNYGSKRLKQIIKLKNNNELPSINDIVSSSFKEENKIASSSKVYAMGSMLIRYLYRHHPDKFKAYLKIIAESERTRSSNGKKRMFTRAFGDPENYESEFMAFVDNTLLEFKAKAKQKKQKKTNK